MTDELPNNQARSALSKSKGRKYATTNQQEPVATTVTETLGLKFNYTYSKLKRFFDNFQLGSESTSETTGRVAVKDVCNELKGHEALTDIGITISWSNVTVQADAIVGSSALPSLPSAALSTVKTLVPCVANTKTVKKVVLSEVSGQLKPGRSTLLLGASGSGKSALLSFLAGRIKSHSGLRVTGDLLYSGREASEFEPASVIALVAQEDVHLAMLSVEQTIEFAYACQHRANNSEGVLADQNEVSNDIESGNSRPTSSAKDIWDKQDKRQLMYRVFNLQNSLQTRVGNDFVRGISGGEKKRLSVAEVLVGPRPVLLLDQPSNGLDSSITFTTIDFIATATRLLNLTTVVALQQPTPEVMLLFDDIMLIAEGKVLFHGPLEKCAPYITTEFNMYCPPRHDTATFFLEVMGSAAGQRKYSAGTTTREGNQKDDDWVVIVDEMADRWKQTKFAKFTNWQMQVPCSEEELQETEPLLIKEKYGVTWSRAAYLTARRHLTVMMRNKTMLTIRATQTFFMGLFIGGLFYQISPTSVENSRTMLASAMVTQFFLSYINAAQMPVVYAQKQVLYKHMVSNFFPPAVLPLSITIAHLPFLALEVFLCTMPMYFMVGFNPTAGGYFGFYGIILCTALCFASFVRVVAVIVPNPVVAQSIWPLYDILVTIGSGFLLAYEYASDCFKWVYWWSPFSYSTRGIANLEFLSSQWDVPVVGQQGYQDSETLGEAALEYSDIAQGSYWVWLAFVFNIGCTVLLTAISCVFMGFAKPPSVQPIVHTEESDALNPINAAGSFSAKVVAEKTTKNKINSTTKANSSTQKFSRAFTKAVTAVQGRKKLGTDANSFTPTRIILKNVSYYVEAPQTWKQKAGACFKRSSNIEKVEFQLLRGITLNIAPGKLHCLIGGSGAGKSTLMDIIAARKTVGRTTGEILVNGQPLKPEIWANSIGYAEQTDIHSPRATVREALQFSARLRLPAGCSQEQVNQVVEDALELMQLKRLQGALVGIPGIDGLTGEQRKRLTIAVELVANPSVLLLDEPTTALDGSAASVVVSCLKNVAESGRTVLASVHQPSLEIFEAFDQLAILKPGGRLVYFGPIGVESQSLISYLTSVPGVSPPASTANSATWALDVISQKPVGQQQQQQQGTPSEGPATDFHAHYLASDLCAATLKEIDEEIANTSESIQRQPTVKKNVSSSSPLPSQHRPGFIMQLRSLIWKYSLIYWRTPEYTFVRLILNVACAICYGLAYWGIGGMVRNVEIVTVLELNSVLSSLWIVIIFQGVFNMYAVFEVVARERAVLHREQAANYYHSMAWSFAVAICELPYLAFQSLLFVPIVYYMINFAPGVGHFAFYLLVFFLNIIFFTFCGFTVVFLTPDTMMAQVASAGIVYMSFGVCGYLIPYSDLKDNAFFLILNRALPTTWSIYAIMADQQGTNTARVEGTGQTVAEYLSSVYGYDYDFRWTAVGILGAFLAVFCVGSALALRYLSFHKR